MEDHEYVDQGKLQDDLDDLKEFIQEDLEIKDSTSALMLLNEAVNRLQIKRQRESQSQRNSTDPAPDDSASYIG